MLRKQEFCFGRKPVLEALLSGRDLERIFLRKGLTGKDIAEIERTAREQGVPVNRVPREKLNRLTNLNHQGILALLSPIRYYRIEDIVDQCFAEGRDPLIVLLDGVTDVGNFGAICRTALGLEVDAVVVGHYGAAPVNAQAVKSSAGAILHLKICRHAQLKDVAEYLSGSGVRLVALDASGGQLISEMDTAGPLALVLGSEGEGVSRELLDMTDTVARLPINQLLESYNVSAAAAMALYEIRRSSDRTGTRN